MKADEKGVEKTYSQNQLQKMSIEELSEIIQRDKELSGRYYKILFEDAKNTTEYNLTKLADMFVTINTEMNMAIDAKKRKKEMQYRKAIGYWG